MDGIVDFISNISGTVTVTLEFYHTRCLGSWLKVQQLEIFNLVTAKNKYVHTSTIPACRSRLFNSVWLGLDIQTIFDSASSRVNF